MTLNQQYSKTMRIAIPLDDIVEKKTPVPRVALKSKPSQTAPWIVTETNGEGVDRYQELLHSLYDAVLITRASGQIVDVNARAMSFLLYDKDELSKLNISDIIIGAGEQLLHTICRNIENSRFTLIDAYCRRKDESTFPAEIATNRLVLTKEGHLCFFVRDITRRKKAEAELIQTVSKLKELDTAKSRLIANVSHELRTPLTIINSFVSLVHGGMAGAVSDQQKECLSTVLRNCDRLANLIDDILDLGRIESGREEFKRRRMDLPALLRQCHHDFLPKFIFKRQELRLEIPEGEFPSALGDADKIAQVITNLVGNANKFTPEGGTVVVKLSREDAHARVDVLDNGPGIATEDQKNLFEAFTQVERSANASGSKGTGLGLTICKQIIEAHDGFLKLESETGKGCCFSFSLPLYNEQIGFDAFIGDRSRFMLARNRKPMAALVTAAEKETGKTIASQLAPLVAAALGCAEWHAFALESENAVFAVTDRTDLKKDVFSAKLQSEVRDKLRDLNVSLSCAFLLPEASMPLSNWLAEAKTGLEPLPAGPAYEKAIKIMIVDDDPSVLAMMREFLGKIGGKIEIKTTGSGYDACIQFGNWKPDLVILDLHLPDIDGRKVFESMLKGASGHQMKFLAISGHPDDIREIMRMGCNDYLAKPFDFNSFSAKIGGLLGMN